MSKLTKSFDKLPWILRLILALPVFDGIVYGIYRILKGHLIAGLIWIFLGIAVIGSIIDIVSIVQHGKVTNWAK